MTRASLRASAYRWMAADWQFESKDAGPGGPAVVRGSAHDSDDGTTNYRECLLDAIPASHTILGTQPPVDHSSRHPEVIKTCVACIS